MTNTIQLRTYIDHQGIKLGHIASVLGMSSSTLRQKLNNERPPFSVPGQKSRRPAHRGSPWPATASGAAG